SQGQESIPGYKSLKEPQASILDSKLHFWRGGEPNPHSPCGPRDIKCNGCACNSLQPQALILGTVKLCKSRKSFGNLKEFPSRRFQTYPRPNILPGKIIKDE